MSDDDRQKLNEVYEFMQTLKAQATIPYDVAEAFRLRVGASVPDDLVNAPVAHIDDATGGSTIDSEARSAVNDVLSALQTLGLMQP